MELKTCRDCKIEKDITLFVKSGKGPNKYRAVCKECWNSYIRSTYYKTDYKETRKRYKLRNKEKLNNYQNQYRKKRKKEDPLFKMSCNIRTLIANAFHGKGVTKRSKTCKILGCDFDFFKEYIEAQFTKEMNWDNIHLDHIRPISLATTKEELLALNHYTNFQPLLAEDNRVKHTTLVEKQLRLI